MLENLTIRNYALIDNLEITFSSGFTIITGETGSGKSIMLDALSLLLGERSDAKALSDKSRKAIIEATFTLPHSELKPTLEGNGIDWNPEALIVRREILPNGRSRAFVNDSPVNISLLAAITRGLIDIHSQHNNILLSRSGNQLSLIDAFSGTIGILEEYQSDFREYVALRSKIKKEKEKILRNKGNRDFIAFQLEQLDKLQPKAGELERIEREFEILSDADQLRHNLSGAYDLLEGSGSDALSQIGEAYSNLMKINFNLFGDTIAESNIASRLENIRIELKDIAETLSDCLERVETNPSRLDKLTSRMNMLYEGIKRFKVEDNDALARLHSELKRELSSIDHGDEDISNLENEAKRLGKILKSKADSITARRIEGGRQFAEELTQTVIPLGLQNVKFSVEIVPSRPTCDGQDSIEFLCSFNKNHAPQPMSKIASGGELSRLMLGIKKIMASYMNMPTVIFDEIDTGVSGEIADKMGSMMKEMGENMQVIAVTHLPQVAAKGDRHFRVYKTDMGEKTVSHVLELDNEERIIEIASMLSGAEVNEAAKANAIELLNNG